MIQSVGMFLIEHQKQSDNSFSFSFITVWDKLSNLTGYK